MTDPYRDQYRRPEDAFAELFFTIWRTCGRARIVDPEVEKQWRRILGHIPVDRLQLCFDEYLQTAETNGLPAPGRLLAIYNRRLSVQQQRVRDKQQVRRAPLSARERAWRTTQAALAKAMTGLTVEQPHADFDPSEIVQAALLVDLGPEPPAMDTEAHRAYDARRFAELRTLFDSEYKNA